MNPTDPVTILIAICTCQKYADRREAVRETWFPRGVAGIEARLFMGRGAVAEGADLVVLDVADDYGHLPEKVMAFFRHALENHEFEWLFKCDDDTYLAVDRLQELARAGHDFVGNVSLLTGNFASGGAGYLIRRWLVEAIVRDGRVPDEGLEDRLISAEAFRLGAVTHASPLLGDEIANDIPRQENLHITCHWVSPAKMRALDFQYHHDSIHSLNLRHPQWEDGLMLYDDGSCWRRGAATGGKWSWKGDGATLRVEWFDHTADDFLISDDSGQLVTAQKATPPDMRRWRTGGDRSDADSDFTSDHSGSEMEEPLRVVLGSDSAGIEPNATLVGSLLRHTTAPVHVRIFSRELEERAFVSGRLTLEVIRTPEELRFTGPTQAHVSSAGAFDRMAALACCRDWDRAVVFDYDQVVIGDPTELFRMDLGDSLAAVRLFAGISLGHACREFVGKPLSGGWRECEDYRFFHMGPVLNLAEMRKAGTLERFVAFHLECGMEEQVALCAACGDRVIGFDETLNWFPSGGPVPDDAKVVHFYGAWKPWREPKMYGAPFWRADETTWQELTCGLWNSQPRSVARTMMDDAITGTALRAARQGICAMRVLEIGGWDFPRMVQTAREWLRMPDDRWHMLFRPHVDAGALEEAIERFGAGLGGLAARTEVLDGDPAEILAWWMNQDDGWERLDAVILHASRNSADFLTEATMGWKLLRPGGLLLIHPVAEEPGWVGVERFRETLTLLMAALLDQRHNGGNEDAMIHSGGPVVLCKLPAAGTGPLGVAALHTLTRIADRLAAPEEQEKFGDQEEPCAVRTVVLEM